MDTVGIPNVSDSDLMTSEDFPAKVVSMIKSGDPDPDFIASSFWQTGRGKKQKQQQLNDSKQKVSEVHSPL